MPITSLRRSDSGLACSGSTRTSVPSGKFASGGRTTVPFETTPTKLITTPRLSTRVHYTLLGNPSYSARVSPVSGVRWSPPESRNRTPHPRAGAVTRRLGGTGGYEERGFMSFGWIGVIPLKRSKSCRFRVSRRRHQSWSWYIASRRKVSFARPGTGSTPWRNSCTQA
jgi:hypothetical protein